MLFKDIDIFITAAQAILQGHDPYSLPGVEVFYPLPFYFLFLPLAALPLSVVHVLWTAIQGVILVAILRRRALLTVLSIPVLLTFLLGQVDIVMLGLFALLRSGIAGGVALAFLVLKPQLVLLLAPWLLWQWWQRDRRQIVSFVLTFGTILVTSFLVQSDWIIRLLSRSGERVRLGLSSSIWGLLSFLPAPVYLIGTSLIVATLVLWVWRKKDFDWVAAVGLLISPFIFSYNLLPLLSMVRESRLLLGFTVLSWLMFAVAAYQSADRAAALLTIAVLLALLKERHKHALESLSPSRVQSSFTS